MSETQAEPDTITREITIDATIDDVWEAISTDEGRAGWLEPDEGRTIVIESSEPPTQVSWWWWRESDDEPARHVGIEIAAVPGGTRVTVVETRPSLLPLAELSAALTHHPAPFELARA